MEAQITNFTVTGYSGHFTAEEDGISVEGSFSSNAEKRITNIEGTVARDGERIGNFSAYWTGTRLRYNLSDADIDDISTISEAIAGAQEAVSEQIAGDEES